MFTSPQSFRFLSSETKTFVHSARTENELILHQCIFDACQTIRNLPEPLTVRDLPRSDICMRALLQGGGYFEHLLRIVT
jgi:hypothetical protein